MSEPAVIQTLAAWLETAGPKRCITWIAETCDEIAIRDIPAWRFWIEMGSLFRDIAAALPTYNEMPTDNVTGIMATLAPPTGTTIALAGRGEVTTRRQLVEP